MKFNKYVLLLAAGISLVSVAGCTKDEDFLEEHSYKFDGATFYHSQQGIEQGLNSVYSVINYMMMGAQRTHHSYMLNGCGLDTFTENSNNDHFSNWALYTPSSGYARHWSDYLFRMVERSNIVIDAIKADPEIKYVSEDAKNSLLGEAIFMRAFAYRVLAGMYGNVPILETQTTEIKNDYKPVAREEVWAWVKTQFEEAEKLLPTEPRVSGAVVKPAAAAYLAEVCLALGKFDEAEKAATRVIDKTDGDYQIMTTRFGSRKGEATDRYGNPVNAYWDLFREGGNQRRESGNKEVLWGCQYNYGTYTTGGSGDSWFRTHFNYIECGWLPGYLQSPTTSTITLKKLADIPAEKKALAQAFLTKHGYEDGETVYKYGVDLACYPKGVTTGSKASTINEAKKDGRWEAVVPRDSIGGRCAGNGATGGNCEYPTRAMYNGMHFKDGSLHGFWDDPDDFRGCETMIQKDYYLPGGVKWSEVKAMLYERQEAGLYTMTAADTVSWAPRFWKFSDDRHPNGSTTEYDCDWYMLRVAEVYLLRAEAYLAMNNKGKAAADINVLRQRAGAKLCSEKDINIDYILDERARELFAEEHRQITLNRLSCNSKCTYIQDCYPVQNATESNTLYARTKKYGFGFENNATTVGRQWNDKEQRYESNIKPHNYQSPIPVEVIEANTGYAYPQNPGY